MNIYFKLSLFSKDYYKWVGCLFCFTVYQPFFGSVNLDATILIDDIVKAFDSINRGKMRQILLAYGLPKETVKAIMMLYRNTKIKVCSTDGDTDYFDIVAGVLLGDT